MAGRPQSYYDPRIQRLMSLSQSHQRDAAPQYLRLYRQQLSSNATNFDPTQIQGTSPAQTQEGILVAKFFGRIVRTRRAYRGLESMTTAQENLSEMEWVMSCPLWVPIGHADWVVTQDDLKYEVVLVSSKWVYKHGKFVVIRGTQ